MLSLDKLRGGKFANWSQNERSTNFELYTPSSIEEVTAIIAHSATANKNLRVIGAGHSFSPVAKPEHSAMTLHNMRGMITIDEDKQQATFWAGTYLHEVGPLLAKYGLALENMGDIAEQSIAGAISTGTHGTGLKLRSVSNQIVKWCFIDGQGHYQEVGRDQDDLSQALHISLGLLGVIVQVTFQAVPLYALRYTSSHVTLADTLRDAQGILQQYRHAEWFYFPGQEKMQLKTMEQIQLPMSTSTAWQKWTDDFMENTVFHMLSSSCKWYPKATKWVSKVSANAVPVDEGSV